jgi:hypothetical protein
LDYAFFTPWHRVIPRESGHVIAFSGGRGKPDLMASVGAVCKTDGLPVVRVGPEDADPGDTRLVLADADGPSARPVRPAGPDLCWPRRTSLAVVEVGAGAVGGFVGDALAPQLAASARLDAADILTWERLSDLLLAPQDAGWFPEAPVVLALTGLHDQPDSIGLFGFVARVMTHPRLPIVLFCSGDGEALAIRACCRTGGTAAAGTRGGPAR